MTHTRSRSRSRGTHARNFQRATRSSSAYPLPITNLSHYMYPPTHKPPIQTAPPSRESRLLASDELSQARYPRLPSLLQYSQICNLLRPRIEHPERDVITCPTRMFRPFYSGEILWGNSWGKQNTRSRTLVRLKRIHATGYERCRGGAVLIIMPRSSVRPVVCGVQAPTDVFDLKVPARRCTYVRAREPHGRFR